MEYRTSAGEVLLTGTVVIDTSPNSVSGIRCQCCADVVSCSQFEAHAGEPLLCAHLPPTPCLVLIATLLCAAAASRAECQLFVGPVRLA